MLLEALLIYSSPFYLIHLYRGTSVQGMTLCLGANAKIVQADW